LGDWATGLLKDPAPSVILLWETRLTCSDLWKDSVVKQKLESDSSGGVLVCAECYSLCNYAR